MNYHQYYPTDMLNGPGIRNVLFVSGCTHGCKGCYNESTWNPKSGMAFTKELEDQIIRDLQDTRIKRDGLTLSGGDPLHERNILPLIQLVQRVRKECPDKTIWMWTGYTLPELEAMRDHTQVHSDRYYLATLVDVLVDGKFVQELHDPTLKFVGSSNQNIIEIKNVS
ncbi:hypothetical protein ECO319P1_00058 [Escherichia phage ECO319P1]|nr:hypothetical protein ECO319P1_00058 [Escherichia phage ECO319P1]